MNKKTVRSRSGSDETTTFFGRVDGTQVSVDARPGTGPEPTVVRLRTQSSLPDIVSAAYLAPDEAHRLAAALVSAARTASTHAAQTQVPDAGSLTHERPNGTGSREYVVTVSEGSALSELCRALGVLPAHARLVDFGSDTNVTLVFHTDSAHECTGPG
ncbi:hypothetical protein [Frankia sp. Cppng1_Ct_nod]|uniref:hypothetical protein n=1 Tax=Frankia sp. Cppng1_Ct_nod TaxID=2897162 RepID=UPI00202407EC|nr:hypothetical protein [Frankia sp. Cppng1_Ct_nod]